MTLLAVVLALEVPVVVLAGLWLVNRGRREDRVREEEFQVRFAGLVTETVEQVSLGLRTALGFSAPGEEPVKPPDLYRDQPVAAWELPDAERDDPWALDGETSLLQQDDGSFIGFGDAGLPVPPGETGE